MHLLKDSFIDDIARPSDVRDGRAIFRRGGVNFIKNTPSHVEAWVGGLKGSLAEGGSQRRRTQFAAEDGKLTWHCACTPKSQRTFCKHCVGLALTILSKKE